MRNSPDIQPAKVIDGEIVVDPKLLGDADAYRAAVLATDATPEQKSGAILARKQWNRATKDILAGELTEQLTTALAPYRASLGTQQKVEEDAWSKYKFTTNPQSGEYFGIDDPRFGEVPVPGLKEFAAKAARLGVPVDEVLDIVKTRNFWGSAEDSGNMLRRDPVSGDVIINPIPKSRAGTTSPVLFLDKELIDKEAKRLDLSEDERDRLDQSLDRVRDLQAQAIDEQLSATSFDQGGAFMSTLGQIGMTAAEFTGLKADYKGFKAANPDMPLRDVVEKFTDKTAKRNSLLKFTDAWATSMGATASKFESGAVGVAAFAADVATLPFTLTADKVFDTDSAMTLSRVKSEIYKPIEERTAQAEAVNSVPFASDIANEAAWMLATGGAVKATQVASRATLRELAGTLARNATGRTSNLLARSSRTWANLRPEIVGELENFARAGTQVANAAPRGTGTIAEGLLRPAFSALPKQVEAKVLNAINTLPTQAVVYGTASARSASAVFGDAYQAGLANGMSPRDALTSAVYPTIFAAAWTPAMMRLVPGGAERVFGGKPLTDVTLGQLVKTVGANGLAKSFKDKTFRTAAKEISKGLFKESLKEGIEESLDETGQVLSAIASYNPDMTVGEAIKQIGYAGALGTVMGAGANAVMDSMQDGDPLFTPPVVSPAGETAAPAETPASTTETVAPAPTEPAPEPILTPEEELQAEIEDEIAATIEQAQNAGLPETAAAVAEVTSARDTTATVQDRQDAQEAGDQGTPEAGDQAPRRGEDGGPAQVGYASFNGTKVDGSKIPLGGMTYDAGVEYTLTYAGQDAQGQHIFELSSEGDPTSDGHTVTYDELKESGALSEMEERAAAPTETPTPTTNEDQVERQGQGRQEVLTPAAEEQSPAPAETAPTDSLPAGQPKAASPAQGEAVTAQPAKRVTGTAQEKKAAVAGEMLSFFTEKGHAPTTQEIVDFFKERGLTTHGNTTQKKAWKKQVTEAIRNDYPALGAVDQIAEGLVPEGVTVKSVEGFGGAKAKLKVPVDFFTNDPETTALQLEAGMNLVVPEGFQGLNPMIVVSRGEVVSAFHPPTGKIARKGRKVLGAAHSASPEFKARSEAQTQGTDALDVFNAATKSINDRALAIPEPVNKERLEYETTLTAEVYSQLTDERLGRLLDGDLNAADAVSARVAAQFLYDLRR